MFVGLGLLKTGRGPNSFRLALEQALMQSQLKYSELGTSAASSVSPERGRGGREPQRQHQAPGALSWQQVPQSCCGPLGSRWLGLIWEVFLLGLNNPCYCPLS